MRVAAVEVACSSSSLPSLRAVLEERFGFAVLQESPARVLLHSSALDILLVTRDRENPSTVDCVTSIVLHTKDVVSFSSKVLSFPGAEGSLSALSCPCGSCHALTLATPFKFVRHVFTDCTSYAQHCCGYHGNQQSPEPSGGGGVSAVDHVTFACGAGASGGLVEWYRSALGFHRLVLNAAEEEEDGYRVHCQQNGMKLMAMQYFKCSEVGVAWRGEGQQGGGGGVKIVFAEPLPGAGPNQIGMFLEANGGPGVQHVAFATSNIVATVAALRERGAEFIQPPPEYYTEFGRLEEMCGVGLSAPDLEKYGILLDTEFLDTDNEPSGDKMAAATKSHTAKTQFLLQVFTKPLFNVQTFFFEFIQRNGARGFGSGNIRALWRALQTHMNPSEPN